MKKIFFTVYNHFYKDGENKGFKSFQPVSVVSLTLTIMVGISVSFFYYLLTGLKIGNFKLILYLLLFAFYLGVYYFFVSKKGFEQLYQVYKNKYTTQELKKFKYYTILFYTILLLLIIYFSMRINGQSITDIQFRNRS